MAEEIPQVVIKGNASGSGGVVNPSLDITSNRALEVTFTFPDGSPPVTYDERFTIEVDSLGNMIDVWSRATVRIYNLNQTLRDQLTSWCNPFNNRTRQMPYVTIEIKIGRRGAKKTPLKPLFKGVVAMVTQTAPPDICVTMECETCYEWVSMAVPNETIPGQGLAINADVKTILQKTADIMGLTLIYKAKQLTITRFVAPPNIRAVPTAIMDFFRGRIFVYTDGISLIATDPNAPINQEVIMNVSSDTGMIGMPKVTQWGVDVVVLGDFPISLGDSFKLKSLLVKGVDGFWVTNSIRYSLKTRANDWYATLSAMAPAARN